MKTTIAMVLSLALLLSTPFAFARGGASTRAALDRKWRTEQAKQQQIDQSLDHIGADVDQSLAQFPFTPRDNTWPNSAGRFRP